MKTTRHQIDDRITIITGDIVTQYLADEPSTLLAAITELHERITEQRETLDKLPKCWRLVAGKLVQDCVIVPGMDVWELDPDSGYVQPRQMMVTSIETNRRVVVSFHGVDQGWYHSDGLFDSREAAEAAAVLERSDDAST